MPLTPAMVVVSGHNRASLTANTNRFFQDHPGATYHSFFRTSEGSTQFLEIIYEWEESKPD